MTARILPAALALLALAMPALAVEPGKGVVLGTTPVEIGSALAGEGYDLERFARAEGRIDVTGIKENRRIEMQLDPASGAVERIETHERNGPWPLPGAATPEVMAALSAQGYEVMDYERRRGAIEVRALKDAKNWQIRISPESGAITTIEEVP